MGTFSTPPPPHFMSIKYMYIPHRTHTILHNNIIVPFPHPLLKITGGGAACIGGNHSVHISILYSYVILHRSPKDKLGQKRNIQGEEDIKNKKQRTHQRNPSTPSPKKRGIQSPKKPSTPSPKKPSTTSPKKSPKKPKK